MHGAASFKNNRRLTKNKARSHSGIEREGEGIWGDQNDEGIISIYSDRL